MLNALIENSSYYALFILIVLGSGWAVLELKSITRFNIRLLLGFSGGFLVALSFLHLIPEAYAQMGNEVGYFILAGFVLQLVLEFFSKGVEHGHLHIHKFNSFPLALYISLCVHSFLEGMPVIEHHHGNGGHEHIASNQLIIGILLHKIPVTVVLASTLTQSGLSKVKTLLFLLFFSLTMPLGSLTSFFFAHELEAWGFAFYPAVLGIVIGIVLHISTTILFETNENHQFNLTKFASILIGIAAYFIF